VSAGTAPDDGETYPHAGNEKSAVVYVGKEANKLEEVEAALEQDPEVICTAYQDPKRDPWRTQVLPVLRRLPEANLAQAAGISRRRLLDLLTEQAQPHHTTGAVLSRLALGRSLN
jgi:hypothetical protein